MTPVDDNDDKTDLALEAFFESARAEPPALPQALRDRILDDAANVQPVRGAAPGVWAALREALGGWYGVGSLVTAGVAGIWIGVLPPAEVLDPVSMLSVETTSYDLFGGIVGDAGWSLEEEDGNDGV